MTKSFVTIDPGGLVEEHSGHALVDASKKSKPATIPANGNVVVTFFVELQSVPRELVKAYVSVDSNGSGSGPPIVCGSGSRGSDTQFVNCTASFRDREYKTGTYYGIFQTVPGSGFEKYGARTFRVPFYTTERPSAPTSNQEGETASMDQRY